MFLALSVIVNPVLECCIGNRKKTCLHLLACVFTGAIFAFFVVEWDLQKIAHKIVTHVNMHVVLQTVVSMKHVAASIAIL